MRQGSSRIRVPFACAFALVALLLSAGCGTDGGGGVLGGAGSTGIAGNSPIIGNTAGASAGMGAVVPGDPDRNPMAGMGGIVPGAAALPCDVNTVVASGCLGCHGAVRAGGAPMSLVTHADFARDYTVVTTKGLIGQRMKMSELVRIRINREMGTSPMPQGTPLAPAALATLNDWIAAGAPAATAANMCAGAAGSGAAGTGGMGGTAGGGDVDEEWLPPQPGETCYELLTHGGHTPDDTTPYMVVPDEHYEQFYYAVPWTEQVSATRVGARYDNMEVLHHWLLFTSAKPASIAGTHETVIGTQIGDEAALIAGWAVGGRHTVMPDNVELQLPPPGTLLNVQWHYYNSSGQPQPDNSAILICTVPPNTREHVGSITWLGTEDFFGPVGMPPGYKGDFSGTCPNDSAEPIHIFFFWPHMHETGLHMRSVVNRVNGMQEEVFDMPFDFNYQVHYDADVVLQPGDTITSFCSFENNTDLYVPFGPSTKQEMCYQFAFSYPAGALDNGVFSLIGATNTCW